MKELLFSRYMKRLIHGAMVIALTITIRMKTQTYLAIINPLIPAKNQEETIRVPVEAERNIKNVA